LPKFDLAYFFQQADADWSPCSRKVKLAYLALRECWGRSATVCAGNTPGPWQTAGLFTNSRSMTINGLTPGMTYMFQVRAVGGSTRYSDWSNPVSRMCA
jgi:chitodextrinase